MKKGIFLFIAAMLAFMCSVPVFADAVYPYTSPVYTPSATSAAQNFTGVGTYTLTLQNRSIAMFDVSGTCTSLAAVIQASADGTNWRTVNVYPVVTGTITAAASISGVGAFRANVSGAKVVRMNITALTATCVISASASEGGQSLVQ